MAKGIRSYGPGKFSTVIDGYAYDVALDGVDEEESYPDGGGWYGLLMLDKQSREAICQAAHYNHLLERSDGIVEADWFDKRKEALDEWARVQKEFEEEEEGE